MFLLIGSFTKNNQKVAWIFASFSINKKKHRSSFTKATLTIRDKGLRKKVNKQREEKKLFTKATYSNRNK